MNIAMKMALLIGSLLLAPVAYVTHAMAQNIVKVDSAKVKRTVELGPVVVTGSGHHQHLRSTATPVHVITKKEIANTGVTNFQEAITRLMPQMSYAPTSMGSFLRMNGMGNNYIVILINGQKLNGDISGNNDLSRINLARIKRIEVLDGAASALYGSDAIGGVINIITDQPTDEIIKVTSDTRISGKGQFTESVNIDHYSKGFGSYTSFTHDEANSWRNTPYEYIEGDEGETQETLAPLFIGYKSDVFNQRLNYTANQQLSLHAEMSYSLKTTDRPETNDDINGGYSYELRCEGWRWNVGGVYKLNRKSSLLFDFSMDKYEYGHYYDTETSNYGVGDYVLTKDQKLYEGEVRGIFGLYEGSTTIFGAEWRKDWMNSITGDVDESVNTMSAYGQHETKIVGKLSGVASIRYDWHEEFGSSLTPKVALMWAPGRFNFRATYSCGYRSPGLDELYYHYSTWSRSKSTITLGNSDLDPEKSNYFSLNAEYSSSKFSIAVTGYLNYVNDMIVKEYVSVDDAQLEYLRSLFPDMSDEQAVATTRYGQYKNSDKGRITGFQVNASYRPVKDLSLGINYSYTRARYKENGSEWTAFERSIRNVVVVNVDYSHSWRNYVIGVNINGRLQSKTYYPDYYNAPGHGIWNINTTHRIHLNQWCEVQPSLGVDNIFNKRDLRVDGELTKFANFSSGRLLVVGFKIIL